MSVLTKLFLLSIVSGNHSVRNSRWGEVGSIASARPGELHFTFFCDMGVLTLKILYLPFQNCKHYVSNVCSFEKVNKVSLMLYQINEH